MMTSGEASIFFMSSSAVSPSFPGSQMSSRMTSKRRFLSSLSADSALSAAATLYPSSSNIPRSDLRISASSSTMRMLDMLLARLVLHRYCNRQLDDEACADRFVLFEPHRTVVLLHDAA